MLTAIFVTLLFINGCANHQETIPVAPAAVPDIDTAYLLEHRIISYEPRYQEKIITTLPYEIRNFDESYIMYLVARLPDGNSTSVLSSKEPHYYLWLERRSNNWRDFTTAQAAGLGTLKIDSHYSAIRQGHFYKEYTIKFRLDQFFAVQDSGLELVLMNQQGVKSTITVPGVYIQAYLEMLPATSQ